MRITKIQDYSLLFLMFLTKNQSAGFVSLSKIAKNYQISEFLLKKIARIFKKAGLVKSKEGKNGGYTLAFDPKKISLFEILKVLSGKEFLNPYCFKTSCSVRKCFLKNIWQEINKEVLKSLTKISLAKIAK